MKKPLLDAPSRRAGGVATACLALLLALAVPPAFAQDEGGGGPALVNTYARPGIPTMTLYVWLPGSSSIWRVEEGVGTMELLSAIGVSASEGGPENTDIVRVFRPEGGERREIFRGTLRNLLESEETLPALRDQDVLLFEGRERGGINWSAVGTGFSIVTSVILLALNIITATR